MTAKVTRRVIRSESHAQKTRPTRCQDSRFRPCRPLNRNWRCFQPPLRSASRRAFRRVNRSRLEASFIGPSLSSR